MNIESIEERGGVNGSPIHPTPSIQQLQASDSKILPNLSFLLRSKYKVFLIETFYYLQHDSLATGTFLFLNFLMILNFRFLFFENIKKFEIKNVHIANESCCKYEKVSINNLLYFERSKNDKSGKILESFDWSRWMESECWVDGRSSYAATLLD